MTADRTGQPVEPAPGPELTWCGYDYVRVDPGTYLATAVRYQGPDWVRAFGRWGLLIEFELVSGMTVCAFYNLGRNQEAPQIARRGKYFRHWSLANGSEPGQGERMSPEVFLSRSFAVEVQDCESGKYSVVSSLQRSEGIKESSVEGIKHTSNLPSKREAIKQEALKHPSMVDEAVKHLSTQSTKHARSQAPKQLSTQATYGETSAQAQAAITDRKRPEGGRALEGEL